MKVKVRLDTLKSLKEFTDIASTIAGEITLTNGENFRVSAKSLLGAAYTMEWDNVYCECEQDIYAKIFKYIIEE